MKQWW